MIQGLPLIASLAGQAQPPKRKRSFFAGLYDKLSPSDDPTLTDEQREALGRQGLLNLGLGMLQTGGQGFGGAFANGLQSGLLSMREGTQDIANQRYKDEILARTRQGMERNTAIEQAQQGVVNPDGTINQEKWGQWAAVDPAGAIEFRQQATPKPQNDWTLGQIGDGEGGLLDVWVNKDTRELRDLTGAPIGGGGLLSSPTVADGVQPSGGLLGADMLPQLEQAVMQVESGGNPNAVSPKGAIGTMQTMPGTLRDPGYGVAPARDNSPAELERVGKDYLAAMLRQYGDPRLALAAYNWGPGNVDAALRGGKTPEQVIASAPKETRDYVPKVLSQLDAPSPMRSRLGRRPAKGQASSEMDRRIQLARELGASEEQIKQLVLGRSNAGGSEGIPAEQVKGEMSLRKEYSDLIKEDRGVLNAYNKVAAAANNPSAQNDISLVFGYMKMLDPTSVVREGEFATAQNSAGLDDKTRNALTKLQNGEFLTPAQRQEFVKSAEQLRNVAQSRIDTYTQQYAEMADQYGYDPVRATGSRQASREFRGRKQEVLDTLKEARQAIQQGAPREAVRQRLIEMGMKNAAERL